MKSYYGFADQLKRIAGQNMIASNIATRLMDESTALIQDHLTFEKPDRVFWDARDQEEKFIADLESSNSMTPAKLIAIRGRFTMIVTIKMQAH